MYSRLILALLGAALILTVSCKSSSGTADEVLEERTKRSESSSSSTSDGDDEADEAPTDEGPSKKVIRLFDESEVDGDEGGPIEFQGASENSVKITVDASSCESFGQTMKSSVDALERECASDDECTILTLPCAFGCSRAVTAYANLGQVETLAEQYVEECANCKKMCTPAAQLQAVCSSKGTCMAAPLGASDARPEDASDTPSSEPTDEPSAESGSADTTE